MKFLEMWRLSSAVYKEVSFQSIFSLRVGSTLPQRRNTDIKRLVNNARINTLLSKTITTVFMAIFGFTVFLPLTANSASTTYPKELTMTGSITAYLAVVLFLIVFMGLQVSTAFISSRMSDVLSSLPLSKQQVSSIVFLSFLRMFDIPMIAAPAAFLGVYFLVGGTILGGLVSLLSIVVTEIFALALTISLARLFYSKVAGGRGRSKWQAVMRFFFMIVWIIPTFAAYLVVNFAGTVVESFASLTHTLSSLLHVLVVIYPFSYGFLVSYMTSPEITDYPVLLLSIASSIGYVIAAWFCLGWITRTARKIGSAGAAPRSRDVVEDTQIKPQTPWLGIIRKDLRIASRAPSFASLFFLPVMQTAILAISFSSFTNVGLSAVLGILTGMSIITLLLPPTLLSMEGLASSYTRSLPMTQRTLISAKTLLSVTTYVISLTVLFLVALYLGREFSNIMMYGAMHTFSIAAGIMLELTILTKKFWKEGFAVGNIYSRLTTYIMVLIPGSFLVLLPIICSFVTFFLAAYLTPTIFFAIAFAEFAGMSIIVILQK